MSMPRPPPMKAGDYQLILIGLCLSAAKTGVWLWELVCAAHFDWELVSRRHPIRPSMVFYFLVRLAFTWHFASTLAYLIGSANINCNAVLISLAISVHIGTFGASAIFASRALAAWNNSRIVAILLGLLVLGQLASLLSYLPTLHAVNAYTPFIGWKCIGREVLSGILFQVGYNAAFDVVVVLLTVIRLHKISQDVLLLKIVVRDVKVSTSTSYEQRDEVLSLEAYTVPLRHQKILGFLALFPTAISLITYEITKKQVIALIGLPTSILLRAIIACRSYQRVFRIGQTAGFKERRIMSKIMNGEILDAEALRANFLLMQTLPSETRPSTGAAPLEDGTDESSKTSSRESMNTQLQDVESQQAMVGYDDSGLEIHRESSTTDELAATRGVSAASLHGILKSTLDTHSSPNSAFQQQNSQHPEAPVGATAEVFDTRSGSTGSSVSLAPPQTPKAGAPRTSTATEKSKESSPRSKKEGPSISRSRILDSIDSALQTHPTTPVRRVSGQFSNANRPHVYIPHGPSGGIGMSQNVGVGFTEASQRQRTLSRKRNG
ncbi:hypothetical protein A4X09_0g3010 [Tilletia walkeri]|uniref:Uncharacterized protein n=1 Tax=Tilletia walkeri TaxID=117179 RepID=A0A8X7T5L3_9BASI|nr:hypothetical protein A4X09_0g3010 [Tilletia walkeri]